MMKRYRLAAIFLTLFIVFSCSRSQSPIEGSLPDSYTVTTNVSPEGAGEVSPSGGEFLDGTRIEFRANPSADFVFEGWSGDLTGSANPTFLTIRRNLNVTANFIPRDYDLTVEIIGEGVVTEEVIDRVIESQESGDLSASSQTEDSSRDSNDQDSPDRQEIDRSSGDPSEDGIDDRPQRPQGGEIHVNQVTTSSNVVSTTVELTAEPAEGWFFARWEGDLEGDENPQQIIIDEPKSVTAVFEEIPELQLVVNIEGEGTVDIDPDEENYSEGDEVTLTATPADEWEFRRWQGDESSEENPLIITMDEDKEITAVFGRTGAPEQEITQQPEDGTAGELLEPAPAVQLLTPDGDPLEGVTITASLNKSEFSSESTTDAETNSDGVATFGNLRIEAADEGYRINFSADDEDVSSVESSTFDIMAADGNPDESSADVPDGVAGETTVITITVQDRFGNPVSGAAGDLSVTVSGANSASTDVEAAGDPGEYRAEYVPVSIGTDEITIELNGTEISGSPYNSEISTSDVSSSSSTVTADPETVEAGESSEITITLRDEEGNPVSGMEDDISFGDLGEAVADDIEETGDEGVYRSTITSAETGEITVVVTADGVTLEDQPVITFVAGPPSVIEIVSGNNQSAQVASELSDPIVVRVTDAFGNPVEGAEVEFEFSETPTAAAGQSFGDSTVETDENGQAETTVTLGTTPGTYEITADAGVDDTVTFTATAQIGSVSDLLISQQPQTGRAGEALDPAPSVQVVDDLGNAIAGVSVTVSLNGGDLADESETNATSDEGGIAEFENVFIETANSGYTLNFSVGSNALSIESDEFEIEPADPQAGNTTATVPNGSAGDLTSITITVEDAFGNRVEGAADRLEVSVSGDNSNITPESIEDDGNGIYQTGYRPESIGEDEISITLDGTGIQGSPFTSSVATSDADAVSVNTQPGETVAGQAIEGPPSVRVDDEFGNPVEGVEVTVTIAGGGSFNSGTTTVESNSSGIAVFDDLVINSAGSYNLRFNAVGADDDADSDSFEVVPAPPSASSSTATVPDGTAGEETEILIEVEDSFGNPVDGVASDLSVTVSGGNSANPSVSETSTEGRYRAAYTPGNSGTDNIAIELNGTEISGSPFTSEVSAGDASTFSIEEISTVTAGESFTISVTAVDGAGNVATGFDGSASVSVNSGDIDPASLSFSNGEASGSFMITEAGSNREVTVTSNSVSETSNSFTVSPGPVANVSEVSGGGQSGTVESILSNPFVVEVTDGFGNTISGVSVSFSVSSSPGGASGQSVSPASADTDGSGRASTTLTLGDRTGEYVVTAEASGASETFTATAETGTPYSLIIDQQPSDVTAGSSISPAPEVRITDTGNNPIEDVDVTVSLSGGSFSSGTTTQSTNSSGIASFGNLQVSSAGSYQLEFSSGSLNETSVSFEVSAAAASASNTTAVVPDGQAGEETEILIDVEDSFGNSIDGVASDLSVMVSGANSANPSVSETSTDGRYRATYTPDNSGTDNIEITLSGTEISGSPFTSEVGAGDISASMSTVAADPEVLTVDQTSAVTITLRDEQNNLLDGVPSGDINVTASGSATVGSVSETSGGSYEATVDNEVVETVTVTVTVDGVELDNNPEITFESGAASAFSFDTISSPQSVGSSFAITINALDQFGNAATGYSGTADLSTTAGDIDPGTVTLSGGTGSANVEVTESGTGQTITATDGDVTGDSNTFDVQAGGVDADNSSVAADPTQLTVDQTSTVTITLRDGQNNTLEDVSPGDINIEASGSATVGNVSETGGGSYEATVDNEVAETVTVTVTVDGIELDDKPTIEFQEAIPPVMVINQQPEDTQAGLLLSPSPSVQITDSESEPVNDIEVTVNLTGADFTAGSQTTAVTLVSGIAIFDELTIEEAGTDYELVFTADNSEIEDVTSESFTVTPADVDTDAIFTDVPNGVAGEPTSVTITLEDRFGNRVTDLAEEIGFLIQSGPNSGESFGTVTEIENGVYSSSYTPLDVGTDEIEITLNGDPIPGSPFESEVEAGQVATLNFTDISSPQVVGEPFSITVTARDSEGNLVNNFNETAELSTTVGSITPEEAVFSDGELSIEVTLSEAGEEQIITVLSGEINVASNTFEVVGNEGSIGSL